MRFLIVAAAVLLSFTLTVSLEQAQSGSRTDVRRVDEESRLSELISMKGKKDKKDKKNEGTKEDQDP